MPEHRLKAVLYISDPVKAKGTGLMPRELPEIYQKSRRNNAANGISGLLSFTSNQYIQLIEGKVKDVDRLFDKIQADSRHTNVQVLAETNISKRYLEAHALKLVSSMPRYPAIRAFIRDHSEFVVKLSQSQQALLGIKRPSRRDSYAGTRLRLERWPDFKRIRQTPSVIEFCAHLASGVRSYDDMTRRMTPETRSITNRLLTLFDEMGILIVDTLDDKTPLVATQVNRDGFYQKMKMFLAKR